MKTILHKKRLSFHAFTMLVILFFCNISIVEAQTYYPMSGGNYAENFADIANATNWPNAFNGASSTEWIGFASSAGTIPSATVTTSSTLTFVTGTSGGVQRGTANIQLLSTGATSNTSSAAIQLLLNFTGRNAGTLSFDAATVFNSTGDRIGTLKVYASIDGTAYTELTGTNLPYIATNNVAGSASITSIALPASFNNNATARLKFYYYNGTAAGSTGSRPKISIDNIAVTSTPATSPVITPSTASLSDFGSVNVGFNSGSQSFTVDGADLGINNIAVVAPTDFQVSLDDITFTSSVNLAPTGGIVTGATVYARFSPLTGGAKSGNITLDTPNATQKTVAVSGTAINPSSNTSDIVENGSFTYPADIDYASYQAADITDLNSIEVAGFTIRDGGATAPDADALGTELNSISFSLSNFANIRRVALYDGTTELGEVAGAATVTFSGLTLTAGDDSTKNFSLRITFNSTVVDNQQFQFAITAVAANVLGSTFSGPGTAVSSIAGNNNKIEVTASKIVYGVNAGTSVLNVAMTPSPTVRALDANNILDLDYTAAVDITSTGTLAVSPTSVNAANGVATFTNLVHTQTGLGLQLTAASGAFTPIASALFDVYNPIFVNQIVATNPGASNPFTTGQLVDPNLTVSGIGRSGALTGVSAVDRYAASGWNSPSFDTTKYFEFTITPNPGYEIDFVNFIYTGQASGSGPTSFSFRSSVDGYTAEIGTPAALGANISLTGAAYQDVAAPITFRIYGYGASAAGGTFSVNGFTFNGSVSVSPIPSISALPNTLSTLDYFVGSGPSASQSFNVNAASLDPAADDLTVTASSNFEISTDDVNFANITTISYTGGTVTNVPVYVRTVAGLGIATYTGSVTVTGGDAPTATVNVQGIVRTPFAIPYTNSFRTQAVVNDAVAQGFVINNSVFNPTGYEQLSINGYIETPTIDFTQLNTMQVAFSSATFGGNTGQTLQLQISTDDGANYTPLATFALPSSTFAVYKTDIDFASYPSAIGKLRVQMTAGTNTSRFRDFYILNTTTWNGTAWSNGTPDASVIATIEGDYNSIANGALTAKNLTVTTGNVTIASGDTMHLEDELTVNGGSVSFENNANLIQVNTATNTGNITIERDANMRRLDYVYWGSPVTNQLLLPFSPQTLANRFYEFNETTDAFAVVVDPAVTNFALGKGYSIRAPNDFTTSIDTFLGFFTGVPHNGTVNVAVTNTTQGYNIIANPYPSPISATAFASANPTIGTLYFWTHTNQVAASGANYATFNGTGAASPNGSAIPNGTIQVGQGFLIQTPSVQNVVFTNIMRTDNHQDQFFRNSNTNTDKSRIWLNLSNATELFSQLLVGYIDGATNDVDVSFDGKLLETEKSALYNLINDAGYVIQGKALPFAATDIVPLGFKAVADGNYTITMDHFDGLFADGQDIFLKDNLTGITHNIKENPYTFATVAGTFNNRFSVVYQNSTLGIEQPSLDAKSIVIFKQNNVLNINAGAVTMTDIKIFDIRGRMIYNNNNVNASTAAVNLNAAQQVLVVQITSDDHKKVSKKVVF